MIATTTGASIMASSRARDGEMTTSAARSARGSTSYPYGGVRAPSTVVRVVQYPRQRRRLRIGGSLGRRPLASCLVCMAPPRCRR